MVRQAFNVARCEAQGIDVVLLHRGFLAVSRAHEPCGTCGRPNAVVLLQRRGNTNHRRTVRRWNRRTLLLNQLRRTALVITPRAVFLLQTLFAPATWAVPCIVAYGSPVVNNWVHARTRRVPTEIVRDLGTNLKAAVDPQHLGILSS